MLFNSITFFLFLIPVFTLYWLIGSGRLRAQQALILVASYFFYGWWDWRFLLLLIGSTVMDYGFGLLLGKESKHRKLWLVLSIVNNLGVLLFFKYYNFFIESFQLMLKGIGWNIHPTLLHIALPVGISFYTFHGMSYVFDIYRDKQKPVRNFLEYAVFVCFFPLLVAGPIERASHLIPQIQAKKPFNTAQAFAGLRLMLWGFFKKVVIADTLAVAVAPAFRGHEHLNGSSLVLAAIYFSIQIYGDFSGYSDIALGTSKLFGFELYSNFRFPYFSRNIAEFWQRWHLSLTGWFRDYLYIPLGGSKNGKWITIRNTFIVFLVSGFWHGANYTFIFWGLIHALLFLPLLLHNKTKNFRNSVVAEGKALPSLKELFQMLSTFLLVTASWVFFRSATLSDALSFFKQIPDRFFTKPAGWEYLPYVIVLLMGEWYQRHDERNVLQIKNHWLRYFVYWILCVLIVLHFPYLNKTQFIYFQF
ncbi:MAG: MBOAT family protein [Chitinophagaceae bacterium]|uniref:MBOAT family O-acyltransferase n=1 Tax=unclassified Paraflavitalea TaxID=2798305 RepID=UPI003D33D24D|nr:MBOAT family protein [Chitinophagaceae bacterium]